MLLPSAPPCTVPQAVCQCGDSEWKLAQLKRQLKAAALRKREPRFELGAGREGAVLAATAAKSLNFISPPTAVVSQILLLSVVEKFKDKPVPLTLSLTILLERSSM
ncbi:hypothetical protein HPB50_012918 [Hyalomma asiaticum]|uniref:Uncharacterized protein n=1 Tax=Hyalomma asiaticum TaxID=266040 RepID=A0ACB7RX56_HYAAI|nr:hypothetical protein HPB50_012918 [Hyalomma asiaticum]